MLNLKNLINIKGKIEEGAGAEKTEDSHTEVHASKSTENGITYNQNSTASNGQLQTDKDTDGDDQDDAKKGKYKGGKHSGDISVANWRSSEI